MMRVQDLKKSEALRNKGDIFPISPPCIPFTAHGDAQVSESPYVDQMYGSNGILQQSPMCDLPMHSLYSFGSLTRKVG